VAYFFGPPCIITSDQYPEKRYVHYCVTGTLKMEECRSWYSDSWLVNLWILPKAFVRMGGADRVAERGEGQLSVCFAPTIVAWQASTVWPLDHFCSLSQLTTYQLFAQKTVGLTLNGRCLNTLHSRCWIFHFRSSTASARCHLDFVLSDLADLVSWAETWSPGTCKVAIWPDQVHAMFDRSLDTCTCDVQAIINSDEDMKWATSKFVFLGWKSDNSDFLLPQ